MAILAEKPNKFWNRTDDSNINRGNTGKLNDAQTNERARLHAERMAYGKPTIQQIVDHWYNAYGIRLTYGTEKEWAWRNEAKIVETMNQLVDDGKLKITITDQSLLNSVNVSGVETGRTIKALEAKFMQVLKKIDFDMDPLATIGMTEERYLSLPEDERKSVDEKIKKLETRNKMCLKYLPELSSMIRDHKKILLDTITTTKEIYDDAKLKELKIQDEVRKQVGKRLNESQKELGFDPVEVEVTDSDRKALGEPR